MSLSSASYPIPLPPVPVEVYARMLADLICNIWNTGHSSDEVAARLCMPHDTVLGWVRQYRAAGLALKTLPREEDRIDHLVTEVQRSLTEERRKRVRQQRRRSTE